MIRCSIVYYHTTQLAKPEHNLLISTTPLLCHEQRDQRKSGIQVDFCYNCNRHRNLKQSNWIVFSYIKTEIISIVFRKKNSFTQVCFYMKISDSYYIWNYVTPIVKVISLEVIMFCRDQIFGAFFISVRPSECNNSASTGRFWKYFIFELFFLKKICRENSSFIKIRQG